MNTISHGARATLRFAATLALLLAALGAAGGCTDESAVPPVADADTADAITITTSSTTNWAISRACTSCLLATCLEPDASTCPYVSCSANAQCNAAFSAFTVCYAAKRSLSACRTEVENVKASMPAATDLLVDGFLLDCFTNACEVDPASVGG